MGAMSFFESMLRSKERSADVPLNNFTGMFTRPKLMAPDHIALMVSNF
jgi:hypothetical protein